MHRNNAPSLDSMVLLQISPPVERIRRKMQRQNRLYLGLRGRSRSCLIAPDTNYQMNAEFYRATGTVRRKKLAGHELLYQGRQLL